LPVGWCDVARTLPLTEERQSWVVSGDAVLANVGVRRYAALISSPTLFHLGLVPRATPGGHYLEGRATEPREHLSAAVLFELLTALRLPEAPTLRNLRAIDQSPHRGVLGDASAGEVRSEVWRTDRWVLRASRCVASASPGRVVVQVALQHGTGEPLAAFVTLRESPSGAGESSSAELYLHGVPAVVAPVADRVRGWLVAHGWSVEADWVLNDSGTIGRVSA
jgi:hypothetical protein